MTPRPSTIPNGSRPHRIAGVAEIPEKEYQLGDCSREDGADRSHARKGLKMPHPFSKRAIEAAIQAVADARAHLTGGTNTKLPSDMLYAEAALSAALAVDAVAPQSWQPIETVPNTAVLFYFPTKHQGAHEQHRLAMYKVDLASLYPFRQPSHWMPLPPPPADDLSSPPAKDRGGAR
jgi:hypothetical protein